MIVAFPVITQPVPDILGIDGAGIPKDLISLCLQLLDFGPLLRCRTVDRHPLHVDRLGEQDPF